MDLDTPINRAALINVFPDLADDGNFKVVSPQTPVYNCIAWAMGITNRWVDFYIYPGKWWPPGVQRNQSCQALVDAFIAVGFELTDNYLYEEGFRKVILYRFPNADIWTHASLVVTDEIEHSKFGEAWDGLHSHNKLLNTSPQYASYSYGVAYACMRAPEPYSPPSIGTSKITVDGEMLAILKKSLPNKH